MSNSGLLYRVRQAFEWEDYVRAHHSVKNTPSDELRVCCFHCFEHKHKLYVNPTKGVFFCQKCTFNSKNNDVFDFVAETEGITRGQAMTRLVREYSRILPDDIEEELQAGMNGDETPSSLMSGIKTIPAMPEGLVRLTSFTEANKTFWTYLTGRGLTASEITSIGFYYTQEPTLPVLDSKGKYRGDLAGRIVVPIYGGNNELVSWQGRLITAAKDPMKYLSCPESEMGKTVWPYVPPRGKHAVLVEGIYDALAVRRTGMSAYATFTKKISLEQTARLKTWGIEEVTLFWDKRDASKDMIKAVKELHMFFKKVYVCRLDDWPIELDAGNMLADPEGTDKLKKALEDIVDTYDDLEFAKWQLKAREWSL